MVIGILGFDVVQLLLAARDNDELRRLWFLEKVVADGKTDALKQMLMMPCTGEMVILCFTSGSSCYNNNLWGHADRVVTGVSSEESMSEKRCLYNQDRSSYCSNGMMREKRK